LVILGAVVDGESSNEREKLSPAAPEQEQRFSELVPWPLMFPDRQPTARTVIEKLD